jgi:hypothetical protein
MAAARAASIESGGAANATSAEITATNTIRNETSLAVAVPVHRDRQLIRHFPDKGGQDQEVLRPDMEAQTTKKPQTSDFR